MSLSSVSDPDDEPEFVAEHRLVIPLDEEEAEDKYEGGFDIKLPPMVHLDASLVDESEAVDTTDRDRALADLDSERKLRRKLELELSEFKFKYQVASDDAVRLREELASVRAVMFALQTSRDHSDKFASGSTSDLEGLPDPKRPKILSGSYELIKSMLLSPTGRCRVVAACDYINLLCVSQPSSNPLFKGFGFRKVHTGELRPLKYIHLHSQPIRDLALHPELEDGIVASASMDKSLKLTSLLVDQVSDPSCKSFVTLLTLDGHFSPLSYLMGPHSKVRKLYVSCNTVVAGY
ncbi:unnamed protein product [Dibothriocephalus latus]|uniref:RING-type E3 ubiquitin transferase n=1 Tax=Dibothriocephalus latus TaxID=60516 RepID=A0A3P6QRQ6_DIBLA|nr:unnamed protein product [Dibothriocephalus latus]